MKLLQLSWNTPRNGDSGLDIRNALVDLRDLDEFQRLLEFVRQNDGERPAPAPGLPPPPHLLEVQGTGRIRCSEPGCGLSFVSRRAISMHRVRSHGAKPRYPARKESGNPKFRCDPCAKNFNNDAALWWHLHKSKAHRKRPAPSASPPSGSRRSGRPSASSTPAPSVPPPPALSSARPSAPAPSTASASIRSSRRSEPARPTRDLVPAW